MKNILLSALFLGSVFSASAQSAGWSASPLGATGGDLITITIDPNEVCNDGTPGLGGATIVRLHSGVKTAAGAWQSVVGADAGANDAIVGFTQLPNGKWSKTFRPSDYYGVAAADIQEINGVLNGGPAADVWSLRGKYLDANSAACGDLFMPLPLAAPFGVTATKKAVNAAFSLRAAYPNPASAESNVRVTLNQSGRVLVTVKNLLGQTVSTLANGLEVAGEKVYTWNAANAPSGIYFYTVETSGLTASAKINVVK